MKSISVVVCAFNEEKNIRTVLEETLRVLSLMAVDFELIVVDDGSNDHTLDMVRSMIQQEPRIRIIAHAKNQGIGASLFDGYREARKDVITFLPADGQIAPGDVKLLADHMADYDMVVSYYDKRDESFFRVLTSRGVRVLLFLLFGRMPRYEGTYMFKRQLLEVISLKMQASFVLNYELVIKAYRKGFKINEVPTKCLVRMSGASKVLGIRKIFFILYQIIQFRLRYAE